MAEESPDNIRRVCKDCMEKNKGTFDIEIGDYVKLRFGGIGPGEYMWVKVNNISGKKFVGTLDNDPVFLENVKCGDVVTFDKGDVCDRIRD
jgi:uncharacterized protein YegJ (DUF2314 family)